MAESCAEQRLRGQVGPVQEDRSLDSREPDGPEGKSEGRSLEQHGARRALVHDRARSHEVLRWVGRSTVPNWMVRSMRARPSSGSPVLSKA